ncbi:lysophospholipid transporter LplT [Tepidimonas charontis]|uniref:Lysophospholipid transporter LplT n=1 Tax=Tepidimonas charontis TaxID=2267262 RepID=A0A554XGT7_9BURK|nr:lysophospholipid transporter LplT [Tepidimonas charontis]TSE35045.1 Lysophospholipid transporter LplT [Tepidimonas charontis]
MPTGFLWLIAAQFVSGLADHALLIVAVALLHEQGHPAWWAPLLKFSFTTAYVVLGPMVGAWSDAVPKPALMTAMNAVKALGALALTLGGHPLLALAWMGIGAALYAPAKYGWITESVAGQRLVAANGWLEGSVVLAVLLGTALGGWLVSEPMRQLSHIALTPVWPATAVPPSLAAALLLILGLYSAAAIGHLHVPPRPPRHRLPWSQALRVWQSFGADNARLWRDPYGGLSLGVTTFFWGFGAVMQFAVLRWAEERLHWPLSQAAYLQAAVALGVVVGAVLVARHITLRHALRVLPVGAVLGLTLAAGVHITQPVWAVAVLVLIGALGGVLVVPMNALLQYRGHRLLSPGRSIAIQGFNENASVLLALALYSATQQAGLPLLPLMSGLGLTMGLGFGLLWAITRHWRGDRATPAQRTSPRPGGPPVA